MAELIITAQVKNEILKNQLKEKETIQQLKTFCESIPSDTPINWIGISLTKDGKTFYFWAVHHNETTNNYYYLNDDFNNHKGWELNAHKEINIKKILLSLIENSIIRNKSDFLKNSKPLKGYYIKELENNKPTTLLKAKNKNFVNFVAVRLFDSWLKINEIDIDENKTEFSTYLLDISNNCWNAKIVRKEASKIFAIYNNDWQTSQEQRKNNVLKRKARAENKPAPLHKKYYYSDNSFLNGLLNEYNLHIYNGFSHNSLMRHEFDTVATGSYIEYRGIAYPKTTEPKTRQEMFNMLVDKSGYFVLHYRYLLNIRLTQLKYKKEQERKEKAQTEWINSNHTEQTKEIENYLTDLKNSYIKPLLNFDEFLKPYTIKKLDILKGTYKDFKELLNFKEFNAEKWQNRKKETLDSWEFNKKIINNNLFGVVGCQHMYIKNSSGQYEMTEEYKKDSFWSKNYINIF